MALLDKDKSTMKPTTFHLRQSMIDDLATLTNDCKKANPDLNKSDVFREAIKRGIESIRAELELAKT